MKLGYTALLLALLSISSTAMAQKDITGVPAFVVCAAVVPCDKAFNVLPAFLGDGSPEGDLCADQYAKVCESERIRFLKNRAQQRKERRENRKNRGRR